MSGEKFMNDEEVEKFFTVQFCDICGRRVEKPFANQSFVFYASDARKSEYKEKTNLCNDCSATYDEAFDKIFSILSEAESKAKEQAEFRKHLDEMMREEQYLDAWKADIYVGDE